MQRVQLVTEDHWHIYISSAHGKFSYRHTPEKLESDTGELWDVRVAIFFSQILKPYQDYNSSCQKKDLFKTFQSWTYLFIILYKMPNY